MFHGYISLAGMEIELSHLLNRKVDLRAPEELSRYFRQQVLDAAYPVYKRLLELPGNVKMNYLKFPGHKSSR
jgi:hypothetical protein